MADDRRPAAIRKPYGLRIQPDLKAQVEAAAKANNRSLNAEIMARLHASLSPGVVDAKLDRILTLLGDRHMTRQQSPRERAARALCRRAGNPENTMFEGRPMWMSYLEEVDVVLQVALDPEERERVKALRPPD